MNKQMARSSLLLMAALLLVALLGVSVAADDPMNPSGRQGNHIGDLVYAASSNPTAMQLVGAMSTSAFYTTVKDAKYQGHAAQKKVFTKDTQKLGDFSATAYYCIYESEMSGTQLVTRVISGSSYELKASFLFGGHGVAMQGTGRTGPEGDYITYVSGGGGFVSVNDPVADAEVRARYAEIGVTDFTGFGSIGLQYPSLASYSVVSGVIGASGRTLIPWYSIAVDPSVIAYGTTGTLTFASGTTPDGGTQMSFRADDTGGAIVGNRIDIYVGEGEAALAQWYATGGNRNVSAYAGTNGDGGMRGFPLDGDSFTLLSTGIAADAPGTATIFASTNMGGVFKANWGPYGLDAYDLATLSFTVKVPNDASTLTFSYRFATDESPDFLGSQYKDFFRVTAYVPDKGVCPLIPLLPDGSLIVHIDNAAQYSNIPGGTCYDPLPPLPEPNDTVYNAVTSLQTVQLDVSGFRGMEMILTIEVADASDPIYDSAVFLDGFEFKSDQPYVITQPIVNAIANLNKTSGYVTWHGKTEHGVWADSTYTYCARFTRMCFGEFTAKFATAIEMYEHFKKLKLVNSGSNPPRTAVIFYDRHSENGNCGHVGISDGEGKIYSVVNKTNGVLLRSITGTFKAAYLGYVTASDFKAYHLSGSLLSVKLASPGSLRVYDAADRVTGLVEGEVKAEIPGSSYDSVASTVMISPPLEDYRIEIHGNEVGTYTLMTARYEDGETADLDIKDVGITPGEVHQYEVSWKDIAEGKKGITITIGDKTVITSKPKVPSAPFPAHEISDVPIDTALSWVGGDDVDANKTLYYEIYLGTDPFDQVLVELIGPFPATQSLITYQPQGNPGQLQYDTTYYWSIVAVDEFGIASQGPIWSFTTIEVIEAEVAIDPETLNLQAPAKWITAYVELPEGYDYASEGIDINTVRLLYSDNELHADWGYVQDGVFMAKFDWATVAGWFDGLHDVDVELTVAGEVDGVDFAGTDTIRVIDPPRRRGEA